MIPPAGPLAHTVMAQPDQAIHVVAKADDDGAMSAGHCIAHDTRAHGKAGTPPWNMELSIQSGHDEMREQRKNIRLSQPQQ